MTHINAPLTPPGRLRMVLRHIEDGIPKAHVATEFRVSRPAWPPGWPAVSSPAKPHPNLGDGHQTHRGPAAQAQVVSQAHPPSPA